MSEEEKTNLKEVLCDYLYIIFPDWQNYTNVEEISGCQDKGICGEKRKMPGTQATNMRDLCGNVKCSVLIQFMSIL